MPVRGCGRPSGSPASHAAWLLLNQIYQTHLNLPASPLMHHDGTYRLVHLYNEAAGWIQLVEGESGVRIARDLNDCEIATIVPLSGDQFRVERTIDHGGSYMSLYGYNQTLLKRVGEVLQGGERIAAVGNTGGHADSGLYFEMRHEGRPFDPMTWVGAR